MSTRKTSPRISVTITTYNRLHYLPQAVQSVLSQSYRDFELIVVENGSTDGTREWLKANPDPRLRVIDLPENIGPFGGMNTAIQAATGEYLTWLGSDDYLANYHLEAFAAALDSDPSVDYAYSPFYVVDADGHIHSINTFNIMLLREIISATHRGNGGFMYKRSIHDEIGLFEGKTERLVWSKILSRYKCIYLMEPTIYYRVHGNTDSVENSTEIIAHTNVLMRHFLAQHDGAMTFALLERLYPVLARKPELVPMALADFSYRLFNSGMFVEALAYLRGIISGYALDDLLRPILNYIAISKLLNVNEIEVVKQLGEAISVNKLLGEKEKSILNKTAGSLISLYRAKKKSDIFAADSLAMPLRYESPNLFSYAAWKNGAKMPPLPAF